MLSESVLKIYSLFSHIGSFQLLAAGALLLSVAALLLALSRKRRVVLTRSVVTDELLIHLGRIADALEHPGNSRADRIIAAASQASQSTQPSVPHKMTEQTHHSPYSLFGR